MITIHNWWWIEINHTAFLIFMFFVQQSHSIQLPDHILLGTSYLICNGIKINSRNSVMTLFELFIQTENKKWKKSILRKIQKCLLFSLILCVLCFKKKNSNGSNLIKSDLIQFHSVLIQYSVAIYDHLTILLFNVIYIKMWMSREENIIKRKPKIKQIKLHLLLFV